jgi:hypothetical protein
MRLAAAALLVLLAGCQYPVAMKYPEPRLAGKTASFGGCGYGASFAGSARRHSFSADDLRRDYASGVKRSEILDEAGFDAADGGTREFALCRCMRYMIEGSADRRQATEMLRSSIRELAESSAAPVDWQDGTPLGRVARFEFTLRNGTRVHAGMNFSGNCVGTVAAIGGSEAAARRFVDSRTPL